MSSSNAKAPEKKTVKESRKRLAVQGVQLQTGTPVRIIVKKKKPFLFSS